MKVFKKFEENLEYLGFELAPVAWDLARFPFESDSDRIDLLNELTTAPEGGMTNVADATTANANSQLVG
jgi:hypothetical protein